MSVFDQNVFSPSVLSWLPKDVSDEHVWDQICDAWWNQRKIKVNITESFFFKLNNSSLIALRMYKMLWNKALKC